MDHTHYAIAKRQRDLAKQQKKEAKRLRKLAARETDSSQEEVAPAVEALSASPPPELPAQG